MLLSEDNCLGGAVATDAEANHVTRQHIKDADTAREGVGVQDAFISMIYALNMRLLREHTLDRNHDRGSRSNAHGLLF